jgi:hypothetical protein
MKMRGLAVLVLLISLLFGCGKKREISGQVFVSSEDGISHKLGAVPISIYPADVVRSHVELYITKLANIERQNSEKRDKAGETLLEVELKLTADPPPVESKLQLRATMDQAMAELREIIDSQDRQRNEARKGMLSMGNPVFSTSTDADGNFSLIVDRDGGFYAVAQASRIVGQDTERYYWIVKVGSELKQQAYLNNLNVIRSADKADGLTKAGVKYSSEEEERLKAAFGP